MSISISINDQLTDLDKPILLETLLETQVLPNQPSTTATAFAVAVNGEFVPRSQYATTLIKQGDQLDIVSPVGGG